MFQRFSILVLVFLFSALPATAEISPDTIIKIFQRLDDLEKKTRELHGDNEVLRHQLDQIKKSQKQGFLNIDERIDEMQNASKEANEENPAKTSDEEEKPANKSESVDDLEKADPKETTQQDLDKPTLQNPVAEEEKEINVDTKPVSEKSVEESKNTPRAPTAYEKETYQAAFNKMSASPTAATQAFKEYIKLQPESPLAANAQYWIGEIMYSHNNYKGAVQEFIKVLQQYKYSNKAPDAALKLGYSFYALKNWPYARRTFEDVIKYFPDNENATQLATKKLEQMKAVGN